MKPQLRSLKKLPRAIEYIKNKETKYKRFNLYFADESRFGLLTRIKRVLCMKGVKPIAPFQHKFDYLYLFGAFSPVNGSSLILEMPFCNTAAMQVFLDELSEMDREELKIVVLDNAAFHHTRSLIIPLNIRLIFLPPYSPELNPAEKIWWVIKNKTSMQVYPTIEDLQKHLSHIIESLSPQSIKQISDYDYIQKTYQTLFNV